MTYVDEEDASSAKEKLHEKEVNDGAFDWGFFVDELGICLLLSGPSLVGSMKGILLINGFFGDWV